MNIFSYLVNNNKKKIIPSVNQVKLQSVFKFEDKRES